MVARHILVTFPLLRRYLSVTSTFLRGCWSVVRPKFASPGPALTENSQTLSFEPTTISTGPNRIHNHHPSPRDIVRLPRPSPQFWDISRVVVIPTRLLRFRACLSRRTFHPAFSAAPRGWPPQRSLPGCGIPISEGTTRRTSSSSIVAISGL